MALGMGNSGKYLSDKFQKNRANYQDEPEAFSEQEKEWMESENIERAGVTHDIHWLVEKHPVDTYYESVTEGQLTDLREVKGVNQGRHKRGKYDC